MYHNNSSNQKGVFQASGQAKPLRYSEECLTKASEGKKARITLINGVLISGVLKVVSMYDVKISDGIKETIVFKSAIATVEVS